ncbi:MAG: RNA methyltransferase [Rhodobacteraceae bacterium]|nr:RNA methyltransferase [Paracoccaceae bacterium]
MPTEKQAEAGPTFVFVRPQLGENLGAAARAMLNFNLTRMRVVQPPEDWLGGAAVARASGAGRVLDEAEVHSDLESALRDFHHVYATSSRARELAKPVLESVDAMKAIHSQMRQGMRVAVLFGPERTGLTNRDLACANSIVEVAANPDYPSLNLAQCALLIASDCYRQAGMQPPPAASKPGRETATQWDKQLLADHFERDLELCGYFRHAERIEGQRLFLRNMIMRLDFSASEVKVLHRIRKVLFRHTDGD